MGNTEQNNFENQMDETTKILISKMERELKAKDDEIRSKEKEIDDLKNEITVKVLIKYEYENKKITAYYVTKK